MAYQTAAEAIVIPTSWIHATITIAAGFLAGISFYPARAILQPCVDGRLFGENLGLFRGDPSKIEPSVANIEARCNFLKREWHPDHYQDRKLLAGF